MTGLTLDNNQLTGPFSTDLTSLSDIQSLNLSANLLAGAIPDDLCIRSTSNILYINGDEGNCSNDFDSTSGMYLSGCCDNVLIDADI